MRLVQLAKPFREGKGRALQLPFWGSKSVCKSAVTY